MAVTTNGDVIVIGAGSSDTGAGCHPQATGPDRSNPILEGCSDLGGTSAPLRDPGIRSDKAVHLPRRADRSAADVVVGPDGHRSTDVPAVSRG